MVTQPQRGSTDRLLLGITVMSTVIALLGFVLRMPTELHVIEYASKDELFATRPPLKLPILPRNYSRTVPEGKTLAVYVRGYAERKHIKEFHVLLRSLDLFWPRSHYNLTVVLDSEDARAEAWAKKMAGHQNIVVRYEDPLPNVYHNKGHARQQWSMMWAGE
jgi:hypothetical protein